MTTLDDVRAYASKHNINITKSDYQASANNADQMLKDKQAMLSNIELSKIDRALASMPKVMSAIDSVALIGFKLLQGIFSTLGIFLVLIAVVVVEIGRVKHGVAMFEGSGSAAFQASFVLVMLNLLLEFLIHYVESRVSWQAEKRYMFSLRLLWQRVAYVLGISNDWTSIEKSPASGLRTFQFILSFGILWLALMGSVGDMLNADLVWHVALIDVFFYSTADAFQIWANGLVVSVLLVFGSQRLTAYIAHKAGESVSTVTDFDPETYHQQAYADELMVRIKAKALAKQTPSPSLNGNGKGHDENPLALPMAYHKNGNGNG